MYMHFKKQQNMVLEKRKEWQRMRWIYGITNSVDMTLSKL